MTGVQTCALPISRNPRIAAIYQAADAFSLASFEALFERLMASGRIAPGLDPAKVARVFHLVGEGLQWRRAVDPKFDFDDVREALFTMIERLLNPQLPADFSAATSVKEAPRATTKRAKSEVTS